jgi:hypothetical protein
MAKGSDFMRNPDTTRRFAIDGPIRESATATAGQDTPNSSFKTSYRGEYKPAEPDLIGDAPLFGDNTKVRVGAGKSSGGKRELDTLRMGEVRIKTKIPFAAPEYGAAYAKSQSTKLAAQKGGAAAQSDDDDD